MNYVEVGGALPVTVLRADGDGPVTSRARGDGIGDAQAHLKVKILDSEELPVGLAWRVPFSLPHWAGGCIHIRPTRCCHPAQVDSGLADR